MTYVGLLTDLHTAISFLAIGLGIPAVASLFRNDLRRWRWPFIAAAALTTLSGFLFPFNGPSPAFVVGIVAAFLLLAVVLADRRRPGGRLVRWTYAGGMVASLYLLVFVLIAQAFQKVPFLHQFAPTGAEPAFAIAQLVGLVVFVGIGLAALRGSAPGSPLPSGG